MRPLIAAIAVAIVALVELCLTGQAATAWRLAEKKHYLRNRAGLRQGRHEEGAGRPFPAR